MKHLSISLLLIITSGVTKLIGQTVHEDWRTANDSTSLDTYINSVLYDILDYTVIEKDSSTNKVNINQNSTSKKITIRHSINISPLVVINGYPIQKDGIILDLFLKDLIEISVLKKNLASALYGTRAKNGAILVTVDKRRFKRLWKQYSK